MTGVCIHLMKMSIMQLSTMPEKWGGLVQVVEDETMPWYREKLPRGSSNIIIQKRWFRFWFFGWHEFKANYSEMSTPINIAKAKCVDMESQLNGMKAKIKEAEREYKVKIKNMEKEITGRDTDGGVITRWRWVRNPFYKFSLFQWGIDYVDIPLAYDRKTYSSGGGAADHHRSRVKSADIAIDVFGKEMDEFKHLVEDDAKDKIDKGEHLWLYTCGQDEITKHDKNKRKNETEEKYKERMEKMEGKLTK